MSLRRVLPEILFAAGLLATLSRPVARAADGNANCTGFIDAVPATISTQGVWCLRADLSMTSSAEAAIAVSAHNVTIDCNGHGMRDETTDSAVSAVRAANAENITVRNCRLLGFNTGIYLVGGGGYLVEDNLIRDARSFGIAALGRGTLVRRNRVMNTRGPASAITAIHARGDVIDNVVDGVHSDNANPQATGIEVMFRGSLVQGNVIRGVDYVGIDLGGDGTVASGNHIVAGIAGGSGGITSNAAAICIGNTVDGFDTPTNCLLETGTLHD